MLIALGGREPKDVVKLERVVTTNISLKLMLENINTSETYQTETDSTISVKSIKVLSSATFKV